jgi:hypothetical protein
VADKRAFSHRITLGWITGVAHEPMIQFPDDNFKTKFVVRIKTVSSLLRLSQLMAFFFAGVDLTA